tara:strand:- start:226 stop:948 length:723 start_codon:yes stop_codon:yes gene_type:complete
MLTENQLYNLDAKTALLTFPPVKPVQTWVWDPPYNIQFKYEGFDDNNPNYDEWVEETARLMFNNTNEGGSMFFIHYPIDCARLLPHLMKAGWNMHQWITWVYPANFGHSKKRFTKASRTILWLSKSEPYFDSKATVQPYKNPNDKRIKKLIEEGAKGTAHYDWWEINLCKNTSSDYRGYANQIPYALIERCILHTSKQGDTIGDPCGGSGSTYRVAIDWGRGVYGCDLSLEAFKLWDDLF